MKAPDEQTWVRVEELAQEIEKLSPGAMSERMAELAAKGEPAATLQLLRIWLSLPPPATSFEPGTVISQRFVLREKIGEGAMGSVWRARQEMIGRDVAVKLIHPMIVTKALRARFLTEIEALGRLNHPGIVPIFDAGFHERAEGASIPFFAMELIEGQPLNFWAESRRDKVDEILKMAVNICAGLQSAHEHRIVHRDLKPSNIMVRPNGRPVILDFGIARLAGVLQDDDGETFSGTPRYAAPEQHLGRDGDFRSGESVDVYAMGVILFEMLTGRPLFALDTRGSVTEMRRIVLEAPIPSLAEVLQECPPALNDVLARALRRDPADRFYSIRALIRAIENVTASSGAAPRPAAWSPQRGLTVPSTQWVLEQKIGEGGAGQVWLGRHAQLGETRVFKFCKTEEAVRTLKRELTLFRLLKDKVGQNPHFIQLHEVSLDEPPCYLMMDYCDARDLDAWCAQQPGGLASLPEAARIDILAQTAEALQAAHEAGIIHRDVKPANLLVRGDVGGQIHVYVADFGIGQIIVNQLLTEGTRQGFSDTVFGTVGSPLQGTALYLAPEVLEGTAATARSDIYSLGVVCWQMIIGDLRVAMDPAGWADRVSDPLLREDLARCLAGKPEKRWSSAGELAASLRGLPARREAAARRREEVARRERAAYRRGLVRASVVAAALIIVFALLAAAALLQRRETMKAHGQLALKQAISLPQTDLDSGRRSRGMSLLELASQTMTNAPALRSASAVVMGMSDLLPLAGDFPPQSHLGDSSIPKREGETARVASHNGKLIARAWTADGLNGEIELFERATGAKVGTIQRDQFPWIPVAEPGLMEFSPLDDLIAIGGSATSHHVLVCSATNGALKCYLYHNADPLCCAWDRSGQILAVGCADGTIRIWDTQIDANPMSRGTTSNQFDVPPALDVPAGDVPIQILRGHRGAVTHLAFAADGRWLASLDESGYLRVWTEFDHNRLPDLPESGRKPPPLVFSIEVRLENGGGEGGMEIEGNRVYLRSAAGTSQGFEFIPTELPAEIAVAPGITSLAWAEDGRELCCGTITDVYWCETKPPELVCTLAGQNPMGLAKGSKCPWLIGAEKSLTEWTLVRRGDQWTNSCVTNFKVRPAAAGQASRTAIATDSLGRAAVYCGRRIEFFGNGRPDEKAETILGSSVRGEIAGIFWDQPGRLAGVCFRESAGTMRLESWVTSTNFPPRVEALTSRKLDCEFVRPANDGVNCMARGGRRGLWRFNPATGAETVLDASASARQNAPFSCTADGSRLAMVVDKTMIRLLDLPSGRQFADLRSNRLAEVTLLAWDPTGQQLASVTADGFVQVWNLAPWHAWISRHQL